MADSPRGGAAISQDGAEPMDSTFVAKSAVRLPGYALLDLIGRGAMGEVWRARQESLGRMVALKMLPEKFAQDADFVARFEKEATALAALSHPNIVQIIDRGTADGRYFFAMEYVQGVSLRERIRRAPLSCLEALQIIRQLCDAIAYAHDREVVHRDLKPENILLDEEGHVKVADFGLAAFRGNDTERLELTATSVAMGTLNYMAPEQRRDAKRVDGRADLYSLGVIIYELLTQDLPVGRFRSPSERVPGLDARLDPIVLKLLEPDPELRPKSAREVDAAIRPILAALESTPSLVPVPSAPPPTRRSDSSTPSLVIRKTRRLLRVALVVIGALSLTVFVLRNVLGFGLVMNGKEFDVLRHGKVFMELDGDAAAPQDVSDDGEQPTPVTDKILKVTGQFTRQNGTERLVMGFEEGGTEGLHTHAGDWRVGDGVLHAHQVGDGPGGFLIPRAYVDDHLFSTKDFHAAVTLRAKPLAHPEADDRQYAELGLRFTHLQVSFFADLQAGLRMSWKYRSTSGKWLSGSTDEAQKEGLLEEVHVPIDRPFLLELQMENRGEGTLVTASLDGRPFAKRMLEGMKDMPGKVALGCRNMNCTFSGLSVSSAEPKITSAIAHEGED